MFNILCESYQDRAVTRMMDPHVTINMCGGNKCAQDRQFQWQYTYHLKCLSFLWVSHIKINNMWNTNGNWRTSFNFTTTNIQISKVCLKTIAHSSTQFSSSPDSQHQVLLLAAQSQTPGPEVRISLEMSLNKLTFELATWRTCRLYF